MADMAGRFSLARAEQTANAVVEKLRPYCKRIEIVGSIRRRRSYVGDIDLVLIPSDPWNLRQEILGLCRPFPATMSGSKTMRISVNGMQVDIYFADEETWATLLLIRQGASHII